MDASQKEVLIFFIIAIIIFVGIEFIPDSPTYDIPVILLSLGEFIFSALTFSYSIQAIKKNHLGFGIPFLVISFFMMLIWVLSFILGFLEGGVVETTGQVIRNIF